MEGVRKEFDSACGGEEIVPNVLRMSDFVGARIQEIEALTDAIENPKKVGMVFQHLPKHMRRRVMGHSVKRLPRPLREAHQVLLNKSGGKKEVSSKSSRRFRRKPGNLLNEYNRRQREKVWLETHIWHAKRFHMIDIWGYRLPHFPNDKSFRACYRAASSHSLVQDISYLCCIELTGIEEDLLKGLSCHSSTDCGRTFAAQSFISGRREGHLMFFQSHKYPRGAIGPVSFIWKPSTGQNRTLWLWSHPAFYQEVLKELQETFEFNLVNEPSDVVPCKGVELNKLSQRNFPFVKVPKYKGKSGTSMSLLKDTLVRLRVTGPLSQSLLSQALRFVDVNACLKDGVNKWFVDFYNDTYRRQMITEQKEVWMRMESTCSPAQFPIHCVLPITVIDPRFTMPKIKTKAINQTHEYDEGVCLPSGVLSPLWEADIRDLVTSSKLSSKEVDSVRSHKVVPGIEGEDISHCSLPVVPLILVQQGSSNDGRTGFPSGWDVIGPCGYGMPLWLSFVFRGGRAGGLRESDSLIRESGLTPFLPPDSTAGSLQQAQIGNDLADSYFRLPPAKRVNYIKMGVPSPFDPPWDKVLKAWSPDNLLASTFFILRSKEKLKVLQDWTEKGISSGSGRGVFNVDELIHALVRVKVVLTGKGTLSVNAMICLPHESDRDPPSESSHKDTYASEREAKRSEHKRELRRLQRKRKKSKSEEEVKKKQSKNGNEEFSKEMKQLWVPNCSDLTDACDRKILGYVTSGGFAFSEGSSCGTGFIALKGLLSLLEESSLNKRVLVRSTNTLQYRFAHLKIITDVG